MYLHAFSRKCFAIALLMVPALLGGCASTKSVDEAKAMAERAQSTADQALAEARSANDKVSALDGKVDRMYQASLKK